MSKLMRVGGLVQNYLKLAGLSERLRNESILAAWPEIAGPEIAARTKAMAVKGGALFIGCASPALAHQLTFLKPKMMEALTGRPELGIIRDIRFQVAEVTGANAPKKPMGKPFQPAELSESERASVQTLADALTDPDVRNVFFRVALAARRRDKALKADGWRVCELCETRFEGREPSECPICRARESEKRREAARAVLGEHPWWALNEVRRAVDGLEEKEYRMARRDVLQIWGRRIDEMAREFSARPPGDDEIRRLRSAVMHFIMLHQTAIPEQLDPMAVERLFGRRIGRLLFGT